MNGGRWDENESVTVPFGDEFTVHNFAVELESGFPFWQGKGHHDMIRGVVNDVFAADSVSHELIVQ
jgi:hypothetical protein